MRKLVKLILLVLYFSVTFYLSVSEVDDRLRVHYNGYVQQKQMTVEEVAEAMEDHPMNKCAAQKKIE